MPSMPSRSGVHSHFLSYLLRLLLHAQTTLGREARASKYPKLAQTHFRHGGILHRVTLSCCADSSGVGQVKGSVVLQLPSRGRHPMVQCTVVDLS